jgi:hypothetical protein
MIQTFDMAVEEHEQFLASNLLLCKSIDLYLVASQDYAATIAKIASGLNSSFSARESSKLWEKARQFSGFLKTQSHFAFETVQRHMSLNILVEGEMRGQSMLLKRMKDQVSDEMAKCQETLQRQMKHVERHSSHLIQARTSSLFRNLDNQSAVGSNQNGLDSLYNDFNALKDKLKKELDGFLKAKCEVIARERCEMYSKLESLVKELSYSKKEEKCSERRSMELQGYERVSGSSDLDYSASNFMTSEPASRRRLKEKQEKDCNEGNETRKKEEPKEGERLKQMLEEQTTCKKAKENVFLSTSAGNICTEQDESGGSHSQVNEGSKAAKDRFIFANGKDLFEGLSPEEKPKSPGIVGKLDALRLDLSFGEEEKETGKNHERNLEDLENNEREEDHLWKSEVWNLIEEENRSNPERLSQATDLEDLEFFTPKSRLSEIFD